MNNYTNNLTSQTPTSTIVMWWKYDYAYDMMVNGYNIITIVTHPRAPCLLFLFIYPKVITKYKNSLLYGGFWYIVVVASWNRDRRVVKFC